MGKKDSMFFFKKKINRKIDTLWEKEKNGWKKII